MRPLTIRLALGCLLLVAFSALAGEEAENILADDSRATAELEKQIAVPPPGTDSAQELCVFLHKRGEAYRRLGRYEQSLADFRQALGMKVAASPELWCDRWRLQGDIYGSMYSSGDWLQLVDYAQSVGDEYKNSNKWHYFSTLLWNVDALLNLASLAKAEASFQRAGELIPSLRQSRPWAIYGANLMGRYSAYAAKMQALRGNFVESERFRRQALSYAQEFLATISAKRSPEHLDSRLALGILIERKRLLAGILSAQGKTGEAEILARQALQETLSRTGKNTLPAANAYSMLGKIKLQQGQIDEARRLQELALAALEHSDTHTYSTSLSNLRAEIGFLLGVQGRWAEALKVYEQRDQGLRSNAAQFAKTGSNNITWAMALLKNQRTAEAEKMLRAIINWNLRKPFVDPLYLAYLHGYLAIVLVDAGKNEAALAEFRLAFPVIVRQAESDNSAENGGFIRPYRLRLIAEGYLELLSRLANEKSATADPDPVVEAFQVAEVARGSSVQLAIANSSARAALPDAALADLARREQDTSNQISALNKLLIRLASEPESNRLEKTIADIRNDVTGLESEQARLRRELAERYPAYAELVAPKPPTPAGLQKVLQHNEALVAFYVADEQTYVWTITPSQVAFRTVAISRQQIDRQVAALRRAFDLSGALINPYDTVIAHGLYDALLAPDEALWADARILNVIPHGALGQLPFAVLLTPATAANPAANPLAKNPTEQPWLLKKVALAQLPSAGTLISLRGQGRTAAERRAFVGFGDPLFNTESSGKTANTRSVRNLSVTPLRAAEALPDSDAVLLRGFAQLPLLPDTAQEVNEIGKTLGANPKTDIFLGKRATESNVKNSDLAAYRVVAFATHGLIPGELRGLDQPSLAMANPMLTDDKNNDGFLTMSEVLGIKLNADWVVLSACNTASGDGKNEEAVSGLGRAFFFAGTRRLLVSYWPVETVSARLLTTELFRRQSVQPDESKAEALRHSMLRLMASSREYGHPAFWAPFGLVGDAGK